MERCTWIVVADGARGRIFARRPDKDAFEPALPFDLVETRLRTRELVSDRGGHATERHRGGHSLSKGVDAHEQSQNELAHRIAQTLRQGRTENRFDRLVLVAPPAFLGRLRGVLDDATAKLIVAARAKEISALSPHELQERLSSLLAEEAVAS